MSHLVNFPQGTALGVADGVGGWVNSGVDPSLFAQSLMYHAHLHSHESWPSEPESDPTQEHDSSPQVEGLELTPHRCLDLAYNGVLQDKLVSVGVCLPWCLRGVVPSLTPGTAW